MPFKFFIEDLYTRTEVLEPRGWKDINSVLERDFDTHGVFFEYTDKTLKLGFHCDGKTLLEAAYQQDGSEAFYIFEVEESKNDLLPFEVIFSGDINVGTRHFDEDYWEAEISKIDDLEKLKNRAKLKTRLNKQLTHDGVVVSKINSQDVVSLATKSFAQLIAENTGETISEQSLLATGGGVVLVLLRGFARFDALQTEEVKTFTNTDSGFVLEFDDVQSFLTLSKKSALTFVVDADFDIDLTDDSSSGGVTYFISMSIQSSKPSSEGIKSFNIFTTDASSGSSPFNFSETRYFTIGNGPSIFINGVFEQGTTFKLQLFVTMASNTTAQFTVDWTIRQLKISVTDFGADFGTVSEWYNLHDALNKTLNFIIGDFDYLFSNLLGDIDRGYSLDGCLSKSRATNGFRVRQIADDGKAPLMSFKDIVENLDVPYAIGYGIEELESPEILGQFNIQWKLQGPPTHTIWVGGNLVYDVFVGTKISFFNSDQLFGTYEVTAVSFIGVTIISFTSTGTDIDISIGVSLDDVIITSDNTTEFRNRLRLEKWEHFYGDNELIDLGVVQEYSEEPFDDILYNEFQLGFSKFANDEDKPSTLEDFETKSSWGLPLVKANKTLNKIMKWIMSTFLINESRATLFSQKPTTSHKLDDDIFLCDIVPLEIDTTVSFVHNVSELDTITVNADVYENYIRDISGFSIIDATLNPDASYLFDKNLVEHLLPSDTYRIHLAFATVTTDPNDPCTVIGQLSFGVEGFKVEADEKLTSSSGLTGTKYTYNQRRTIKRFLIRWGRYINSTLAYLVDNANETIQNLFYINNGSFSTEIDTSQLTDDCLMSDDSAALVQEDANVETNDLKTPKFKPNIINATVKICDEDFDLIKGANKNNPQIIAGDFDGAIYGQVGYNEDFELQNFDLIIKGRITQIVDSSGGIFALNHNISSGSRSGFYILFNTSGEAHIVAASDASTLYSFLGNHGLSVDDIYTFKVTKRGVDVELLINDVVIATDSSFPSVFYDSSDGDTLIGARNTNSGASAIHTGNISSVELNKTDASGNILSKLIQIDFRSNNVRSLPNKAQNAPISTSMKWIDTGAFASYLDESLSYGFFTVTSPKAKIVTGWPLKITRNPIDKIAKLRLLERFPPVAISAKGVFDGDKYGLLGYHAEFEVQHFEATWIGKWTSINSNRVFGINSTDISTDNSGFLLYADVFGDTIVHRWETSFIGSDSEVHSEGAQALQDQTIEIKIKRFGPTLQFTVNGNQDDFGINPTFPVLWYDNATAETIIGGRWSGTGAVNKFIGVMDSFVLNELDEYGVTVNELIDLDFDNDNGVSVPNNAADAPASSDMIWNT